MNPPPFPTGQQTLPIERSIRDQERRNKAVSLAISVASVALILSALAWIGIALYPPAEPPIVAFDPGNTSAMPQAPRTWDRFRRPKPSPPSAAPARTIAATRTSPISIPVVDVLSTSPEFGEHIGIGADIGSIGMGPGGSRGPAIGHRQRCDSADRALRLKRSGGKLAMDKTVLKALRWLKGQQHEDGHWGDKFPLAMTALALLSYSGHCETVDSPEFGDSVRKAIDYLVTEGEKGKGLMASTRDRNISYEHAIAIYSLSEAYSMNKNARKAFKRISPVLKKAIPIIVEGQTDGGGWLYSYGSNGTGDLSVAGWNIQALKAAEFTGLKFSGLATAKKKAIRYLAAAEDPGGKSGLFKYRIRDGESGRLPLTGVGLLCSRMLGKPSGLEEKGLEMILKKAPEKWAQPNLYAWYYHSQAAFQVGGKPWRRYNDSYQNLVFESQQKDGSWVEPGGHAATLGPDSQLYATCLSTLMMEVYYRYLPSDRP